MEKKNEKTSNQLTIKCECGAEITLNTDFGALRKAIDIHAETHRNIGRDCSKTEAANEGEAELEVERIREDLMNKALERKTFSE